MSKTASKNKKKKEAKKAKKAAEVDLSYIISCDPVQRNESATNIYRLRFLHSQIGDHSFKIIHK